MSKYDMWFLRQATKILMLNIKLKKLIKSTRQRVETSPHSVRLNNIVSRAQLHVAKIYFNLVRSRRAGLSGGLNNSSDSSFNSTGSGIHMICFVEWNDVLTECERLSSQSMTNKLSVIEQVIARKSWDETEAQDHSLNQGWSMQRQGTVLNKTNRWSAGVLVRSYFP